MAARPEVRIVTDDSEFLISEHDKAYTIGRVEGNSIRIRSDGVSRKHSQITFNPKRNAWVVRDLGSKHGTLVNGRNIMVPTALKDGDEINLGGTVLSISILTGEPPKKAFREDIEQPSTELEDISFLDESDFETIKPTRNSKRKKKKKKKKPTKTSTQAVVDALDEAEETHEMPSPAASEQRDDVMDLEVGEETAEEPGVTAGSAEEEWDEDASDMEIDAAEDISVALETDEHDRVEEDLEDLEDIEEVSSAPKPKRKLKKRKKKKKRKPPEDEEALQEDPFEDLESIGDVEDDGNAGADADLHLKDDDLEIEEDSTNNEEDTEEEEEEETPKKRKKGARAKATAKKGKRKRNKKTEEEDEDDAADLDDDESETSSRRKKRAATGTSGARSARKSMRREEPKSKTGLIIGLVGLVVIGGLVASIFLMGDPLDIGQLFGIDTNFSEDALDDLNLDEDDSGSEANSDTGNSDSTETKENDSSKGDTTTAEDTEPPKDTSETEAPAPEEQAPDAEAPEEAEVEAEE